MTMLVCALRALGLRQPTDDHLRTFLERVGAVDRETLAAGDHIVASLGPRIVASAGFAERRPPYEQVLDARGVRPMRGGLPLVKGAVVDPEFAGYGIGGVLMGWIEDQARARGLEELRLTAPGRSEAFYMSLGWQTGGRLWLEVAPGVRLEAIEMHKDLIATGSSPKIAAADLQPVTA
jgi:GNAT superfamily N-acetyltransferase